MTRRGGRLALQLALTALVTWLIVTRIGVTLDEALSIGEGAPAPRALPLLGSAALLLAFFAIAARLWGRMVKELGGRDPGALASFRIVLSANLGRYLPGKVWQVAGLALLSRRVGIPGSLGAGAGAVGQLFHLGGAAVVGAAVLLAPGSLGGVEVVGLAALAGLVVLASIPRVLQAAFALAFRLAGLDPAAAPRPDPLFGPRWLLLHAGVWAGYGAAFLLFVAGLGFEDPPLVLAAAFAGAYLMGYLAVFAPAGIGVREGVLIALLRPSLGAGAVGVAVLARVWMTLVELVPAGGVALWEIFRRRAHPVVEQRGNADG